MTKTAILLPYPAQQEQIVQIAKEYELLDIMCVEHSNTDSVVTMGRDLAQKGCELIIARGVHAQLLREKVMLPLVEMKVTTQEMGIVICRLKKDLNAVKPVIGLVGYSNMFGNTDHYNELFGIHLKKYMVTEQGELTESVKRAAKDGCQAIIGGDTACIQAQKIETKKLEQSVRKIARYSAPVLLMGEKGTGAEYLAEAIHNASILKNNAFVPVECDAWMPETLDDMLFGNYSSRQGAPPCLAELAADGTLYLNNVEMLSRESRYKMLNLIRGKFLHNGSHRVSFFKVRVIASTSVNLVAKVEKGEFRQDLYYALSTLSMEIPPLRHQKEYALYWFNYYIDYWQRKYKRYVHTTQGGLRFVQQYEWPGNLEQMSSVCERIILLTEQRNIDEVFIRRQIEQIPPPSLACFKK